MEADVGISHQGECVLGLGEARLRLTAVGFLFADSSAEAGRGAGPLGVNRGVAA